MFSVYGIGINLGNRKTAILASILTPILPIFLTVQERAAIDYMSASVFLASFYLLFKTEYFTNRKYSIYFGLSVFIGLFTKWPFVIPSIPFIFYAVYSLFLPHRKKRAIVANIFISLTISLLGLSWYFFNFNDLISKLSFFWDPNGFAQIIWNNPKGLTIENVLLYAYLRPIQSSGIGIFILIFFYISIFISKKTNIERYLLSSIIIIYIVLTYLNDKSPFYLIYAYPLIMLLTINALFNTKHKIFGKVALFVLTSFIVVNFLLTQLNFIGYKQISIHIKSFDIHILPNYNTKFEYGTWPTKEIGEYIYYQSQCSNNVLVFIDRRFINTSTLNFYLISNKFDHVVLPAYAFYNPVKDKIFDLNILQEYECVVSTSGYPGDFANADVLGYINEYLAHSPDYNIKKFTAPDNSEILVFVKNEN